MFGEIVKEWSGITYDDRHDLMPAGWTHSSRRTCRIANGCARPSGTFVGLDRNSASLGADEGAAALTRFLSLVAANGFT